jgi:hypothetical protein
LSQEELIPFLEYIIANGISIPQEYLITLHKKSGDLKAIGALSSTEKSLEVSAHFCNLSELHETLLTKDLLIRQLDQYLSIYVGPNSQKIVQLLLNNIAISGNDHLLKTMRSHLKNNYPNRKDVDQIISPNFSSFY